MTVVLDDIDSRVGSTVSLLRTFVGLFLRQLGGWIAVADLVHLMEGAGVAPSATRNAVATLKQKGLLLPDRRKVAGYSLNPAAIPMLERGDKRIFKVRQMQADERWALISFSVAESERSKRLQLRKRLQWLGCGTVAPALWIAPEHLLPEIKLILAQHETEAVIFSASDPLVPGGFKRAAKSWWDLGVIRKAYEAFLASAEVQHSSDFATLLHLVDAWRPIPYLDPGLPERLLPADWPGRAAQQVFVDRFGGLRPDLSSSLRFLSRG